MFQTTTKNPCSTDLLAKIADVIPSPVAITQSGGLSIFDHRIVYINKAFSKLTGYPAHEVLGRSPEFLCDPRKSGDKMMSFFQNCTNSSEFSTELSSFKKDGSEFSFKLDVSPIAEDVDSPHFILSFTEVGAIASQVPEPAYEAPQAEAAPVFGQAPAPEAPAQIQPQPEISEHSRNIAEAQLGRSGFDEAMYNSVVEEIGGETEQVIDAPQDEEYHNNRHNALQEIIDSIEKRTLKEASNDAQVNQAKEDAFDSPAIADELDYYAKSRFLTNMSHDLRTPLNAIIGFSEVIRDQLFGPIDNPRYISYANDIYKSGQELLGTVSEILELSEVEEQPTEVGEAEFNLSHTIDEVIELLSSKAFQSGVRLTKNLNAQDIGMKGDKLKLKQAIAGVLGNAIKASPKDGELEIFSEIAANGNFNFAVYVKSATLMGTQANIGALLGTVTTKLENEYPEISLAKKFVEAHDGAFKVFNSATSGTEITINIPAEKIVKIQAAKSHLKVIN